MLMMTNSCIKENLDNCDNLTIYFQYLADGEKDVLYQYISKIDLYVFDKDGHIKGVRTYNKKELETFSGKPSFKLPPGTYNVVAVGNQYDNTTIKNIKTETDFNNIFIQHPNWGTEYHVNNHDDNYMGQKTIEILPGKHYMARDTVTLQSSHIDIDLEITGLSVSSVRNELPVEIRIEKSNAQCSFNNSVGNGEKGICYPDLIYDGEKQCYRTEDFALFRMDTPSHELEKDYCQHELVVIDKTTGKELLRGYLFDYILKNSDYIDITKQEAYLPVQVQFMDNDIVIKVPDWYIEEDVKPGFE